MEDVELKLGKIGYMYNETIDEYLDVHLAYPKHEMPYVYLAIPKDHREELVCVWIDKKGIEFLKEVVRDLEEKIKIQTSREAGLADRLMKEFGFNEKTAVAVEQVVIERFTKFYKKVVEPMEEHLVRLIAEEYPEVWKDALKLTRKEGNPLYEACLRIFSGCLEEGKEENRNE